jgi:hypothetical protein
MNTRPTRHSLSSILAALVLTPGTLILLLADCANAAIDPGDFVSRIDNPYFPLIPGTTYYYKGTTEGHPSSDVFAVTHETKQILGVTTTVIHDQGYVDGILAEDTLDWFAQDEDGNVWYFGEDTKELDAQGNVISTEGSWQAGVDGALPGIVMEAQPRVGDTYQQEFATGVAEDMATVLSLRAKVKVPFGTFSQCLKTSEFTPLEPGSLEYKFYAPGIGFISSVASKGGRERFDLVDVVRD